MENWFEISGQEVLKGFCTDISGISSREAARRLEQYGENVLEEKEGLFWWQVFLAQFKDLLVMILIAAAAVSMMTGDAESALVIFVVLMLNAVLGTIQQQRAEKTLNSLKQLSSPEARVIREGASMTIPSSQVVPGDILALETGDLAAADGRLLSVYGLMVNESSLTGESMSVEKQARPIKNRGNTVIPIADQNNMVFSGSLITSGRAVAVVTATGMDTEIGRIAYMMNGTKPQETPLQASLNRFSGHLAAAIIGICMLVFLLNLSSHEPVMDALMFAVALAVAAIPEALSSIVTIVQAMGTQKMAKEQAIIKDLKAVESLGCVSVICSDKTGTLTQNRMDVEKIYINHAESDVQQLKSQSGRLDVQLFLWNCVLNSNASPGAKGHGGNPLESALLRMAAEAGVIPEQLRLQCPRKWELPFDSARKMMITVNDVHRTGIVFAKGAVDVLAERCSRMANPAGRQENAGGFSDIPSRKMTERDLRQLLEQNRKWSEKGFRVLAFACCPEREAGIKAADASGFIFLGLAAMMDPPRPESRFAVASARQAGIRPVMITGDHKVTAMAIARRIGIFTPGNEAVTGAQLDEMDEGQLDEHLEQISVYARVSPQNKIRIVEAWQRRGHIVAMTGDGVNDAPALKKADIGVAMGMGGTEVSKDAASMILADDNFLTIIKAVANGRNVYKNIKNAIQFLLSGNMAGILCVLYTTFLGLPLPFAPVHLLFINLVTDSLPAIAIGMEPAGEDLLRRPPRNPGEGILTPSFLTALLFQGGLMAAATMWAYGIGLKGGGEASACTMAFSTLILARLFHGFNCRDNRSVLKLGLFGNPYSIMAFLFGVMLLALVLFVPVLGPMFSAVPLNPTDVFSVVLLSFFPTVVIQLFRLVREMFVY